MRKGRSSLLNCDPFLFAALSRYLHIDWVGEKPADKPGIGPTPPSRKVAGGYGRLRDERAADRRGVGPVGQKERPATVFRSRVGTRFD